MNGLKIHTTVWLQLAQFNVLKQSRDKKVEQIHQSLMQKLYL